MKNLSLVLLICFSPILQDLTAASNAASYAAAAAAQTYANSSAGVISTATNNLKGYNETLNGVNLGSFWTKGLLSDIEVKLCGANVILDASVNVTSNGLSIDATSGNYTNCNEGATGAYNTWLGSVTCWQNYIQGLTTNKEWEDAYDACVAAVGGVNSCGDACTAATETGEPADLIAGDNFYYQIGCIDNIGQSNVINVLSDILGSTGPNMNAVNDTITDMNNALTAALNYMGSKNPEDSINQVQSIATNINNNLNPLVQNSYNAYITCYNNNWENGKETCWSNWVSPTNFTPAPCASALQTWLSDLSQLTSANEQLLNFLTDLYPYGITDLSYGQRVIPTDLVSCILPNLCTYTDGQYNCSYSVPEVNGDLGVYVEKVTADINTVNALYSTYHPFITSSNARVTAIMNQIQLLGKGISQINDSKTGQVQAILSQCTSDIAAYQAQLAKREAIVEAVSQVLGMILGFATIEFTGGLGIAFLPQILMVLMMIPQVNNATIGALSTDISEKIADAAVPVNSSGN